MKWFAASIAAIPFNTMTLGAGEAEATLSNVSPRRIRRASLGLTGVDWDKVLTDVGGCAAHSGGFRNPTQHPEKIYDIEEAQDLLFLSIDAVKSNDEIFKHPSLASLLLDALSDRHCVPRR